MFENVVDISLMVLCTSHYLQINIFVLQKLPGFQGDFEMVPNRRQTMSPLVLNFFSFSVKYELFVSFQSKKKLWKILITKWRWALTKGGD